MASFIPGDTGNNSNQLFSLQVATSNCQGSLIGKVGNFADLFLLPYSQTNCYYYGLEKLPHSFLRFDTFFFKNQFFGKYRTNHFLL